GDGLRIGEGLADLARAEIGGESRLVHMLRPLARLRDRRIAEQPFAIGIARLAGVDAPAECSVVLEDVGGDLDEGQTLIRRFLGADDRRAVAAALADPERGLTVSLR